MKAQQGTNDVSNPNNLINKFKKSVQQSLANRDFNSKCYMSTFTVLKIDIDNRGEIKDLNFSDNVDTLFSKSFFLRHTYKNERAILTQYIKLNAYKNISVLIPINYEPFNDVHRNLYYDSMESFLRFNKKDFTGKAVMLSPIEVKEK